MKTIEVNKRQEVIREVTKETQRFNNKLDAAFKSLEGKLNYDSDREWAALKRATLDLKKELSKITLFNPYETTN